MSYAIYRIVPFPVTLSDPLLIFQGYAIFTLNISEMVQDSVSQK